MAGTLRQVETKRVVDPDVYSLAGASSLGSVRPFQTWFHRSPPRVLPEGSSGSVYSLDKSVLSEDLTERELVLLDVLIRNTNSERGVTLGQLAESLFDSYGGIASALGRKPMFRSYFEASNYVLGGVTRPPSTRSFWIFTWPEQAEASTEEGIEIQSTLRVLADASVLADNEALKQRVEALLRNYEFSSMDTERGEFEQDLGALVLEGGSSVLHHLDSAITAQRLDPEATSDILGALGKIHHPETHRLRMQLLVKHLHHASRWARDGAALGLVSLGDSQALQPLRDAVGREQVPDLKRDLIRAVRYLESVVE